MDKKIATALLAIGLCLFCPPIWNSIQQYRYRQLSIDLALWFFAFAVLIYSGFKVRRASAGNPFAMDSKAVASVLLFAFLGLLLGVAFQSPAWTFSGWGMCLSCLVSLLLGFDKRQLVQLSLLSVLSPWLLWEYGAGIHWFGQRIASALAGSVLDIAKVFYYNKGNIIGLVSAESLPVQQCAGLRLLWPSLLTVAAYGFLRNYTFARWFFLVFECLFWIVVANAARIAYCLWVQDGQSGEQDPNFLWLDIACAIGILFLAWSGDQFYAAFFYQEKELDREESGGSEFRTSSITDERRNAGPFWALAYVLLSGVIGLGGWISLRGNAFKSHRYDQQSMIHAIRDIKIDLEDPRWDVSDASVPYEVLAPVFRQSDVWPQRQWVLADKGDQDRKPVMRLRIDGLWYRSPRPDWLWRWFGWEIEGLIRDERKFSRWTMTRSIVEEGFVVSGEVYLSSADSMGAPRLQVSLVREGFKSIDEVSRLQQEELFLRCLDSVRQQLQVDFGNQAKQQEAP